MAVAHSLRGALVNRRPSSEFESLREVIVRAMKSVAVVALAALIGCSSALYAGQENDPRIERVENGLRPYSWALFGDEEHFNIIERLKFYKVPGVSIAVIENGRLVWAKGYGVKDFDTKEPVTVNTLFQAASISKSLNDTPS
jgi:hypothetical protein